MKLTFFIPGVCICLALCTPTVISCSSSASLSSFSFTGIGKRMYRGTYTGLQYVGNAAVGMYEYTPGIVLKTGIAAAGLYGAYRWWYQPMCQALEEKFEPLLQAYHQSCRYLQYTPVIGSWLQRKSFKQETQERLDNIEQETRQARQEVEQNGNKITGGVERVARLEQSVHEMQLELQSMNSRLNQFIHKQNVLQAAQMAYLKEIHNQTKAESHFSPTLTNTFYCLWRTLCSGGS